MRFFENAGKMAIGSRIRLLGEKISEDAKEIYKIYGSELHPKWFPVFYTLTLSREKTAATVADDIGHSHVSVGKISKEMRRAGLLIERPDAKDRRRTLLRLSKRGMQISKKMQLQYLDVNAAIEALALEANHDLWTALQEWEELLSQKSLIQRVVDEKKRRESGLVRIVRFRPQYRKAFRDLNLAWIKKHFKVEPPDHLALDHPKKYILDPGGVIFVALLGKRVVGVCALLKKDKSVFELAKMAVAEDARGKNIGYLLGEAVIAEAMRKKARSVFLESNTILKPAIGLYKKLGFKKIVGPPTPYERCNIQMEKLLGPGKPAKFVTSSKS